MTLLRTINAQIIKRLPQVISAFSILILAALSIHAISNTAAQLNASTLTENTAAIKAIEQAFMRELRQAVTTVQSTAGSTLVRNALVDSLGAESYLRPHFSETIVASQYLTQIALTSDSGRLITSNATNENSFPDEIEKTRIEKTVKDGTFVVYMGPQGSYATLIAPVYFPPSRTYAGALVARVNFEKIKQTALSATAIDYPGGSATITIMPAMDKQAPSAASPPRSFLPGASLTSQAVAALPAPFSECYVLTTRTSSTATARAAILFTILTYLFAATVVVIAYFLLSRWLTAYYIAPVQKIIGLVNTIAHRKSTATATPTPAQSSVALLQSAIQDMADVMNKTEKNFQSQIRSNLDELSETRTRLEDIASSGGIIALSIDLKSGLITHFTESLTKLLATPPALNQSWLNLYRRLAPSERKLLRRTVRQAIRHDKANTTIALTINQHTRTYDVRLKLVGKKDRHGARIDCVAFDNTEKASSEMALAESEVRKAAIINGALDGFIMLNTELKILEVNPATERMLGYRNIDMLGLGFVDHLIAPASRQGVADCLTSLLTSTTSTAETISPAWCAAAKSASLPVEISASLIEASSGRQINLYLKDLRKTFKQQQAIARKDAEIGAIFSLSPEGFASFDDAGLLSAYNKALCTLLFADQETLAIGMSHQDFWILVGQHQDYSIPPPIRTPEQNGRVINIKEPNKKRIKISRKLLSTAESTEARIYYFHDITEDFQLATLKNNFLATAAHELRTPLTTILGFSELLSTQEINKQESQELASSIFRHSVRLSELLNDLLDLAKIDDKTTNTLRPKTLDLVPLVTSTIESISLKRDEKRFIGGHEVTLHVGSVAPWMATVDQEKIRRAILNLLSNATKYSAETSPITCSINGLQKNDQHYIEIAVSDQGIGMTADQLEHAFMRFWRADSTSGSTPGTGLGLSLVKEITEAHHGTVHIRSEYGVGTTVSIVLPVADPEPVMEMAPLV